MGNYKKEIDNKNSIKLQRYLSRMPQFYREYMSLLNPQVVAVSTKALYAYNAYDFFAYIVDNNPAIRRGNGRDEWIGNLTIDDIENITSIDANEYSTYLSTKYSEKTTLAKLNAISSMYLELQRLSKISANPFSTIRRPKEKKRVIVHLTSEERKMFMDAILTGEGLTKKQKSQQDFIRDIAIYSLFLDTGMRVSELVGINVDDIDFYEHSIIIMRKGGKQEKIFFSDEAEDALREYLEARKRRLEKKGLQQDALFLNNRLKRLSTRSVEILTKQYTSNAAIQKKISPHKLRSTFACDFYDSNPDLLLLQRIMGHENIATTTIYAEATLKAQKEARNFRQK